MSLSVLESILQRGSEMQRGRVGLAQRHEQAGVFEISYVRPESCVEGEPRVERMFWGAGAGRAEL
jgi:hypothetical protein